SGSILGLSPLLAKEIAFRTSGSTNTRPDQVDTTGLYDNFRIVINPLLNREWQPGIVETDEGVEAYSVYPIESIERWHPTESVSEALSAYYGAAVGEDAYNAAKVPVQKALDDALGKLGGKLASLERSMTDESDREILRKSGELVLAYQYTLQKGQSELQAQYDPDQPAITVTLDPKLTPLENAQRYFSQYDKAKRALEDVPRLIEETKAEISYLAQLKMDLELASNWPEIDEVQQVLQSKGYWRGKRAGRMGGGKSAPLKYATQDGFVMWIGRNSRQNEIVTFDKGGGADLWLHARDVPGAHVIIKFDGRPIPEPVIERAAEIASFYSANRNEGKVIVDVTECKYVKKIKGSGPGMVTYRNETTRTVTPRSEAE
ncbi:MAG: NFACT family protein, partial [Anaerolineae bacterium]|nr:NFACT family protein [Anaerolineae bacterium]